MEKITPIAKAAMVTNHAQQRMHERMGLGKKSTNRMADIALEKGLRIKETKGKLKKYLNTLYLIHGVGNNIRVYGEKVFVFQGTCLITVLALPNEFKNIANICQLAKKKKLALEQQQQEEMQGVDVYV